MDKHLVVIVHGIGEQVAGETGDAFVNSARDVLEIDAPMSHSTVQLADALGERDGQLALYPCNIRRMQQTPSTELVFSEVHWADISAAPKGVFATSVDLLRTMLGLGYLALDNVQNNDVPAKSPVQWLVPLFVWVFYALIAPLNAALFIGAASLLVDPFILSLDQHVAIAIVYLSILGLTVAGVSWWFSKQAQTYLTRTFFGSLKWMGAAMMLLAVLSSFDPFLSWASEVSTGCKGETSGVSDKLGAINCLVGIGVKALNAAWLFEVLLLIALTLVSIPGAQHNLGNKRSIYLAICAGMLLFWMTFSVAFWVFFKQSTIKLMGANSGAPLVQLFTVHFEEATSTLAYVTIAMVLLVIAAVLVAIRRNRLKSTLARDPDQVTEHDLWYGRLILNPFLNLGLFAAIFVISFGVLQAFAELVFKYLNDGVAMCDIALQGLLAQVCAIDGTVDSLSLFSIALVGAIGFLTINNATFIASALGVGRDIVAYATRSTRANPLTSNGESRYIFADQIEGRFQTTLLKMIAQEGAEHIKKITIVAHSQGTVAAARSLQVMQEPLPVKPDFVTMGSPLTHIYGHYFGNNYLYTPEANAKLNSWINIYRGDDFVGTKIEGYGTEAKNFYVRPAGHINYWTDRNVWDWLVKLDVFAPFK